MFENDRLIYLDMQKTGSQHIARVLKTYIGGRELPSHRQLRANKNGRFVLGSIRNPWDWYVSLWAYGCLDKGALYTAVTGSRSTRAMRALRELRPFPLWLAHELLRTVTRPDWRELWRAVYADADDPALFRHWITMVMSPKTQSDLTEAFPQSQMRQFAGFMTFRYCRLYLAYGTWKRSVATVGDYPTLNRLVESESILDHAIRVESLEDDLVEGLRRAGYDLDAETEAKIRASKARATNTSKHRDAAYYYDGETAALVQSRDRLIIERYGYTNPLAQPRAAASGSG